MIYIKINTLLNKLTTALKTKDPSVFGNLNNLNNFFSDPGGESEYHFLVNNITINNGEFIKIIPLNKYKRISDPAKNIPNFTMHPDYIEIDNLESAEYVLLYENMSTNKKREFYIVSHQMYFVISMFDIFVSKKNFIKYKISNKEDILNYIKFYICLGYIGVPSARFPPYEYNLLQIDLKFINNIKFDLLTYDNTLICTINDSLTNIESIKQASNDLINFEMGNYNSFQTN